MLVGSHTPDQSSCGSVIHSGMSTSGFNLRSHLRKMFASGWVPNHQTPTAEVPPVRFAGIGPLYILSAPPAFGWLPQQQQPSDIDTSVFCRSLPCIDSTTKSVPVLGQNCGEGSERCSRGPFFGPPCGHCMRPVGSRKASRPLIIKKYNEVSWSTTSINLGLGTQELILSSYAKIYVMKYVCVL